MLRSLITQLQVRYPSASLISELLTIHHDSYVVRALVQLGTTTIATGMASALTIESAEDRAKTRALEALGLEQGTPFVPHGSNLAFGAPLSAASSHLSSPTSSPTPSFSSPTSHPSVAQTEPNHTEASFLPSTELPPTNLSPTVSTAPSDNSSYHFGRTSTQLETELDDFNPYASAAANSDALVVAIAPPSRSESPSQDMSSLNQPAPDDADLASAPLAQQQPTSEETPPKKTKPKVSSEPAPKIPTSLAAPQGNLKVDLSDAIAKTSVELKRLKWTEAQGRQHLQAAYGKRSRQHLSDEELLDFLQFLEEQESPVNSSK